MNNKKKGIGGIGIVIIIGIVLLLIRGNSGNHVLRNLLGIAVFILLLLLAGSILLLVFALKGSDKDAKRKEQENPLDPQQLEMLKKGRSDLLVLRKRILKIKNTTVHAKAIAICTTMDKILQTLREKPERVSQIRQFFSYYIPTFSGVLAKFQRIEESGMQVEESTEKIIPYLDAMQDAMNRQYENLFQNDLLDLRIEIEAMSIACKQDGLLDEIPVIPKTEQEQNPKVELKL